MVQDRSGENIGRGISQFGDSVGRGLGDMFERMAKHKEERKKEAQTATSMRMSLKKLDPENSHEYDLMDPYALPGAMQGILGKAQMDADRARQSADAEREKHFKSLREGEEAKRQAEEEQRAAAPGFFSSVSRMAEGQPSVGEMQRFYEGEGTAMPDEKNRPQGRPFDAARDIPRAASESGYNIPPSSLDDVIKAFTKKGGAVPGTVRPVDGLPGYMFGVMGEGGGGSFLPIPQPNTRVEAKDAPKIDGYDILPDSKGNWKYHPKTKDKPAFDISPFDANGDGKLTGAEVQQAMMAAAMSKEGMPYEGMPVGKPGGNGRAAAEAPAPSKGGGLFERFQQWKGK